MDDGSWRNALAGLAVEGRDNVAHNVAAVLATASPETGDADLWRSESFVFGRIPLAAPPVEFV
jgi:hypothetical protein